MGTSVRSVLCPFRFKWKIIWDSIAAGCKSAAEKKGMVDCPFCRTPLPSNDADIWQWFRHGW